MPSQLKDLWPENLVEGETASLPVSILRQQAALLAKKTGGLLVADVRSHAGFATDRIRHGFYIVAPALDDYTYGLFDIDHDPAEPYPVKVVFGDSRTEADSPGALEKYLQEIFSSERTRNIIIGLLAQSKES